MLSGLNLRSGKITYDDFKINFDLPLNEQELSLDEDLVQIEFPADYLIDIGWYPMYNPEGEIKIIVIRGCDWEHPLMKKIIPAAEIQSFWKKLDEAIQFADNLSQSQ